MKQTSPEPAAVTETRWQKIARNWNEFWFAPRDPTMLGLIRICCGAVTLYTVFAYSFMLQDFMGEHAWYDLKTRLTIVRERPVTVAPLSGHQYFAPTPSNDFEKKYHQDYLQRWKAHPPAPYPKDQVQADYLDEYREKTGTDLRILGLRPPVSEWEFKYLEKYYDHQINVLRLQPPPWPPPAYPASPEEEKYIYDYMSTHGGVDPRNTYTKGIPAWSLWFHVTDPTAMNIVHALAVLVTFLFTIGLCTRVTAPLTWITSLWYIHRNPVLLFGVDTMMVILLLYLTIGNSGGAYSVDRLIARWWSKAKPRVVNRWRTLLGKLALPESGIAPAVYHPEPVPTVSTNIALRMLQIHVCIIYVISGLAKLQGDAWWSGSAVWGTLANPEFAPMGFEINGVQVYNELLRWMGRNQMIFETFMTCACLFTLAFEISYPFLIWRPATRWVLLSGAIILHGLIGMFMGLKTFALMMLVMNMAFVRREEALKFLGFFQRLFAGPGVEPKSKPPIRSETPLPGLAPADTNIVTAPGKK